MKRKYLLAIIPACLVLSSCAGANLKTENKKDNLFMEDTLAHEEVFGNKELSFKKDDSSIRRVNIRKLDDVVDHPDGTAAIGIQSTSESSGNISFRFVVPVTFTNANITPTIANWTRTVSKRDGSAYPKDTGNVEVTTAYTKITNGGSEYSISQYNTANGTSFTHFVVYTLRNVPVDSNDYFVSAYLTLSGEGGVAMTTKAIAVNAKQTQQYAYVANLGTSFIEGTFDGTPDIIDATSVRESEEETNKANFIGVSLKENDTFVIKEFYNTKLYVKGASSLVGESNPIRHYFEPSSTLINTIFDGGTYDLHLNRSDELWADNIEDVVDNERYIYYSYQAGDEGWRPSKWWENNDCWTAMWIWGDEAAGKWIQFVDDGNGFYKSTEKVDVSSYTSMSMVRLYYGDEKTKVLSWDKKEEQTADDSIPSSASDCAYICRDGDYQNVYTSWGTRTYR